MLTLWHTDPIDNAQVVRLLIFVIGIDRISRMGGILGMSNNVVTTTAANLERKISDGRPVRRFRQNAVRRE